MTPSIPRIFKKDFAKFKKTSYVQKVDNNMVSLPTTVKVDPAAMRVTSLSAIVLTTCGQDLQS